MIRQDSCNLKIGDIVYYARILPTTYTYEVVEMGIRTLGDSYFVGVEVGHDRHTYLLDYDSIENLVFIKRNDALKKVKEAQKNATPQKIEKDYEEY